MWICRDEPSEFDEDGLHGVLSFPVGQTWQLRRVDRAVPLVHAGQVDHADEMDRGGPVGVLVAAVHLDGVDPVLMYALRL